MRPPRDRRTSTPPPTYETSPGHTGRVSRPSVNACTHEIPRPPALPPAGSTRADGPTSARPRQTPARAHEPDPRRARTPPAAPGWRQRASAARPRRSASGPASRRARRPGSDGRPPSCPSARRRPHREAGRGQRRCGYRSPRDVEHGCRASDDGVARPVSRQPPAVQHDQHGRRPAARHGPERQAISRRRRRSPANESGLRRRPPTSAPSTSVAPATPPRSPAERAAVQDASAVACSATVGPSARDERDRLLAPARPWPPGRSRSPRLARTRSRPRRAGRSRPGRSSCTW